MPDYIPATPKQAKEICDIIKDIADKEKRPVLIGDIAKRYKGGSKEGRMVTSKLVKQGVVFTEYIGGKEHFHVNHRIA